jgi:F0F1-type ATP synthase assembly protein I
MEEQPQNPKNRKQSGKGLREFARYSGTAFQMGAVIFIAVWGGKKLDLVLGTGKPVFTIILSLLGVFAAIYVVIKDFIRFK